MGSDQPGPRDGPMAQVTQVASTTVFSGPLPPPHWLAEYERIHPGLTQQLMDQAEIEAAHRRELATQRLRIQSRHVGRGQWMAFSLSLASLAVAASLAARHGPWAATPFALTALSPIVAAFLKQQVRNEPPPRH